MKPQVLQFHVRSVYGNELIYPANRAAELFAKVSGTKTLLPYVLEAAEELGFTLQQVHSYKFSVPHHNQPQTGANA